MNQSKDRPYSECELIGTHLMNGNICDRCGWKKPEPNPHDNKARDEQPNLIENETPYSTLGKDINDSMAAPYFKAVKGKPKTELPDLDEILEPFIDDLVRRITREYTNPVGNEQLRQDIDAILMMKDQAIAAIQAHIDKARLDEVWKFPGRIKGGPGVPASAWFEIGNAKDIRIAELEARLKSDKTK